MTAKMLPKDITPGMWTPRVIGSGMNLRTVWREIVAVKYQSATRRYYVRVNVPEERRNLEAAQFYLSARVRLEVSNSDPGGITSTAANSG